MRAGTPESELRSNAVDSLEDFLKDSMLWISKRCNIRQAEPQADPGPYLKFRHHRIRRRNIQGDPYEVLLPQKLCHPEWFVCQSKLLGSLGTSWRIRYTWRWERLERGLSELKKAPIQ